jgi:DNA-binding IclR family transcriptional regulator
VPATVTDSSGERFSRIFDVLELLVGHPDGMTLTEIVSHLVMPISSAHNLLQRMVAADVVSVSGDLRYGLGARAVRLGIRIVGELDVKAAARRPLQELARVTGDDVYLAMRFGNVVSYVERVEGTRVVSVDIRLGQPLFLHATSVGKLFAAHNAQLQKLLFGQDRPRLTSHTLVDEAALEREFDRIRKSGYALSREEALPGIVGLAVPVYDAESELVAAVHISTLSVELTKARERQLVAEATAAAASIERELGRMHHGGSTRRTPAKAVDD